MKDPHNRRIVDRAGIASRRNRMIGHGFVMLAIVVLASGPALILEQVRTLQQNIATVIQPARRLAVELRVAFERAVAEQRGFHLAGLLNEPEAAQRAYVGYRTARAEEDALYPELARLASLISVTAAARLDSLQQISTRWHALDDALIDGEITLEAYTEVLPGQRARQDSAYSVLARFQSEIETAQAATVDVMRDTLQRQRALALVLGLVALVAAVGVAWSARREHLLARALADSVEEETRLRDESERRREELEHVSESRAHLIRGFSHDVKNPLGAADGYMQLLEDGIIDELTPRQSESIGKARRAIGNALRLIDDLLELARAESGHLSLDLVGVDLGRIVRETAEQFTAQAEAKGLSVRVQTPGERMLVRTDAARASQVLANLISNAVKYTTSGGFTIRAAFHDDGDGPAPGRWAAVEVEDSGPGIPEDKQRFLFQEFTRLDPGSSHGAGIGLAISRHIAHALSGEITFESEVGTGSTFTFWLPVDDVA